MQGMFKYSFQRKGRSRSLPDWDSDSDRNLHYRIVVMGAARVGKSSIISQFLYDRFTNEYKETIEEFHRGEYTIDGRRIVLDIIDTAGAYSFPAMRNLAVSSSDAFILVYSLDDESSFTEVNNLRDFIIAYKENENVPMVIVGNKADVSHEQRIIERETAESIVCLEWGFGYVEVSAKDNTNIHGIFKEILRQANLCNATSVVMSRKRINSSTCNFDRSSADLKRHSCSIS